MSRRRRPRCRETRELLDWSPPEAVAAFKPETVRAASLRAQLSKAVALSCKESGKDRTTIAAEMSAYLGEDVSTDMLDKYASEAAESHTLNVIRFLALLHATRDRRLLQLLAEGFDWAVVEKRFLPAIELAALVERRSEIDRELDARRRQLQGSGVLK